MSATIAPPVERRPQAPTPPAPAPAAPAAARERLLSLDVFRGMTVAGMLLVNNPGSWASIYAPLEHAQWHGWTPTDLIFLFGLVLSAFPFFQWGPIPGMADPTFLDRVVYRMEHLRIPGVLQRIGI